MGKINLDPYLFFNGDAREALEFYKNIFGGELFLDTFEKYKDQMPEGNNMSADKIMHGFLNSPNVRLMASDSPTASSEAKKIELSISGEAEDEPVLREYYEKLSDGGKVTMPLDKAPWGALFGMVTDKYNVAWMINIGTSETE